jgi:hypothetical protein
MQAWNKRLRSEFERLNEHAAQSVEHLRTMLRTVLTKTKCGKCGVETLDGDLVRFHCPGATGDHVLCFDCLGDRVERQRGYLERHLADVLKEYPALSNICLCYECHCPHVVTGKIVFETGFNQNQLRTRGRQEYTIDLPLTEVVHADGHFKVFTYFENQRRGMFSKFSCSNLTFADARTATSTESGDPIDLEKMNHLSNHQQIWMEDWTCDTKAKGDPQGWSYAVNWPTQSLFSWSLSASFTTFVRRRRMMRAMITLDPRLRSSVEKTNDSVAERNYVRLAVVEELTDPLHMTLSFL